MKKIEGIEYGTCEVFNATDTLKEFLAPFKDQKF